MFLAKSYFEVLAKTILAVFLSHPGFGDNNFFNPVFYFREIDLVRGCRFVELSMRKINDPVWGRP